MKPACMLVCCALLLAVFTFGCGDKNADADASIRKLSVPELAAAMADGACTVLDANGAEYRAKFGVIPGARLLTSYKAYEPAELPADKAARLVFYCVDEGCGNSLVAARRAVRAGHTNVAILPAGVSGWRDAGQTVAAYP